MVEPHILLHDVYTYLYLYLLIDSEALVPLSTNIHKKNNNNIIKKIVRNIQCPPSQQI